MVYPFDTTGGYFLRTEGIRSIQIAFVDDTTSALLGITNESPQKFSTWTALISDVYGSADFSLALSEGDITANFGFVGASAVSCSPGEFKTGFNLDWSDFGSTMGFVTFTKPVYNTLRSSEDLDGIKYNLWGQTDWCWAVDVTLDSFPSTELVHILIQLPNTTFIGDHNSSSDYNALPWNVTTTSSLLDLIQGSQNDTFKMIELGLTILKEIVDTYEPNLQIPFIDASLDSIIDFANSVCFNYCAHFKIVYSLPPRQLHQ